MGFIKLFKIFVIFILLGGMDVMWWLVGSRVVLWDFRVIEVFEDKMGVASRRLVEI